MEATTRRSRQSSGFRRPKAPPQGISPCRSIRRQDSRQSAAFKPPCRRKAAPQESAPPDRARRVRRAEVWSSRELIGRQLANERKFRRLGPDEHDSDNPRELTPIIGRLKSRRVGPIGLDIGTHCVKLIQFNGEHNRVIDAVRWELPASDGASAGDRWGEIASVVRQAREREASAAARRRSQSVPLIYSSRTSGLRNRCRARWTKSYGRRRPAGYPMRWMTRNSASSRRPTCGRAKRPNGKSSARLSAGCAWSSARGRRGGGAPHGGRRCRATAPVRCYAKQFRRDEDQQQRALFVQLGARAPWS